MKKRKTEYGETVHFSASRHRYAWDDQFVNRIPSITQLVSLLAKPALVWGATKVARGHVLSLLDEMEDENYLILTRQKIEELAERVYKGHQKEWKAKADKGTAIHLELEQYLKQLNGVPTLRFDSPFIKAIKEWTKERSVRFERAEYLVASQEMQCAGQVDFTCEIDYKPCIVDLKTGSSVVDSKTGKVYDEIVLQQRGYKECLLEETGVDRDTYILHWQQEQKKLEEIQVITESKDTDALVALRKIRSWKDGY